MTDIKLNEDFDWGFTALDDDDVVEAHKFNSESKKCLKMYDLILPLINNLMKDSDKPIIKWPNRKEKLKEFKQKLEAILNEEET